MNARLARRLASLYPRAWRRRYEEEFAAFLEDAPRGPFTIVNVIWCACREHAREFEHAMTSARRLTLLMYGCLAGLAAGVNLYWTIDDTPIAAAMRTHVALRVAWAIVARGSAAALVVAGAAAAPVVWKMVTAAVATRRYDGVARLMMPFGALAILVGWMSIVIARTHWAPMPWDITGEWLAPAAWPSLTVRWLLGGVTGLLIAIGLMGTAVSLRRAIESAKPAESSYLRLALGGLAAALVLIAAAALGWGLLAEVYASAAFHSSAGGIFGSSIAVSWLLSAALFLGAAGTAVAGVRRPAPRHA